MNPSARPTNAESVSRNTTDRNSATRGKSVGGSAGDHSWATGAVAAAGAGCDDGVGAGLILRGGSLRASREHASATHVTSAINRTINPP